MLPILAIETSQRDGGIALRDAAGVVHVEPLHEDKRHDDDLMPAVERIMEQAKLQPDALEAVGVSVGPGGFTGLRIAVSTAKALAAALGAAVVAVPSAVVAAESLDDAVVADGPVLIALGCKRDSFWATRLHRRDAAWAILGSPALARGADAPLEGITAVVGDRYLPEALRARAAVAGIPIIEPRFDPARCLVVAERVLDAEGPIDPHVLCPLYPRQPEAVSLWEKRPPG